MTKEFLTARDAHGEITNIIRKERVTEIVLYGQNKIRVYFGDDNDFTDISCDSIATAQNALQDIEKQLNDTPIPPAWPGPSNHPFIQYCEGKTQ